MTGAVVDQLEEITPSWLSSALRSSGHPLRVTDVRLERIGSGQMGVTSRLHLSYEGVEGPPTLVAKLAGEDEATRALVAPGYAAEVGFYSTLSQDLDMRTPRSWYAAISDDHTRFTLLLDDLAPARPGLQALGCSIEQAEASLRNLVGLHVPCWNDPSVRDMDFLMKADESTATMMAQVMSQAAEEFIDRYAGELAPEDPDTLRSSCAVIEQWQLSAPEPFSVVHGDYRLDNLLFDSDTGEVTTVDWQTAAIGPPLRDVAYFMGTSLRSEDRSAHEASLVGTYHSAVVEAGVRGYSWDDCWKDYRLGQLQGPMITMIGCIYAGAKRSRQSDEMFIAMARRSCAGVRDLGSLDLI